jgi:hypothetical protein
MLEMSKMFVKNDKNLMSQAIWQKTKLLVYYMGDEPNYVSVRETNGIDFDEVLLHFDKGGSIFITTEYTAN